ncbi:MAG: polysaccharide pyruvyl transferase family protein [Sphingorhabdus sp.]
MASKRDREIADLQALIADGFSDIVSPDTRFALLDFPDHDNIGDSAIYSGELAFLDRHRMKPAYVSTTENCDWPVLERSIGDGPIFLHGGGNFGDLWPWYQPFREEVLRRYPGRPVIQFPQTLFYKSQEALDRTARIIERHGAFTLYVRDHVSYDLATRNFQCQIRLCPDMAFCMGFLKRHRPDLDLLLHLRTDMEAAEEYRIDDNAIDGSFSRADWPKEDEDFAERSRQRDLVKLSFAFAKGGRNQYLETRYRLLAQHRVRKGIALLSRGRHIITNRLHGHILSFLLDIPHCVLDNSYGKTSSFMKAWETSGENVAQADTLDQALTWYQNRNADVEPVDMR